MAIILQRPLSMGALKEVWFFTRPTTMTPSALWAFLSM
jgi:hypothetical protein